MTQKQFQGTSNLDTTVPQGRWRSVPYINIWNVSQPASRWRAEFRHITQIDGYRLDWKDGHRDRKEPKKDSQHPRNSKRKFIELVQTSILCCLAKRSSLDNDTKPIHTPYIAPPAPKTNPQIQNSIPNFQKEKGAQEDRSNSPVSITIGWGQSTSSNGFVGFVSLGAEDAGCWMSRWTGQRRSGRQGGYERVCSIERSGGFFCWGRRFVLVVCGIFPLFGGCWERRDIVWLLTGTSERQSTFLMFWDLPDSRAWCEDIHLKESAKWNSDNTSLVNTTGSQFKAKRIRHRHERRWMLGIVKTAGR